MRNYYILILPVLFASLSLILLFLVMQVFSCYPAPFSDSFIFSGILLWNLFCLSAYRYLPDPGLFPGKTRKPIREEEQKLRHCLFLLPGIITDGKTYRFRIIDEAKIRASCTGANTIIVTKGMVKDLPPAELTALVAHELGHLQSGDAMAGIAFTCARVPPRELCRILTKGLHLCRILIRKGKITGLAGVSFACFLLFYYHLFHYIIACLVFIPLFALTDWLFIRCWGIQCRYRDYKQDVFAYRLGVGVALKEVLKKLSETDPEAFNRIRKLEALEES